MATDMSPRDFAAKVEWEGGVVAALDYGLRASDLRNVPEARILKALWGDLERAYAAVDPLVTEIGNLLEELTKDKEGER